MASSPRTASCALVVVAALATVLLAAAAPGAGSADAETTQSLYLTSRSANDVGYPTDLLMWNATPTGQATQDVLAPLFGAGDGSRSWVAAPVTASAATMAGTARLNLFVTGQLHLVGEVSARLAVLPVDGAPVTVATASRALTAAANTDGQVRLDLDVQGVPVPAGAALRLQVSVEGATGGFVLQYDGADAPSALENLRLVTADDVTQIDDLPWQTIAAAAGTSIGWLLAVYGLAGRFRL